MRRLVLVLATAVRAEVQYTDMQKWAGLLAQSFLAHSDDAAHAHTQLASFKELVNTKARTRSGTCALCSFRPRLTFAPRRAAMKHCRSDGLQRSYLHYIQ